MAPRKPAKVPDDLAGKRPAQIMARDDLDAERMEAEVAAEDDDGSVVVTLTTDLGFADIRVPPIGQWRSMARNALFRMDDLHWASSVLSTQDAKEWYRLDPTQDEVNGFFELWGEATGQNLAESRRERRASARTHRR